MINKLYKHNDTWYKILGALKTHSVTDKNGTIHLELVKEYMEIKGGNHVLREADNYLICETIPEIDFEPIVYTDK